MGCETPGVDGKARHRPGVERGVFDVRSGTENRPDARWRQTLGLADAAIMLTGCADYFGKRAHLGDNPMDQAIATRIESDHMKETRDRMLKKFPIGRPVASVSRCLQSVGAKCPNAERTGTTVTCRNSKHTDIVLRTPLGDIPEIRSIYDFRIELSNSRDLLRDVRVCRRILVIEYRATFADRKNRIDILGNKRRCRTGRTDQKNTISTVYLNILQIWSPASNHCR